MMDRTDLMFPRSLQDRVDSLIDDLFRDGGVDSASLASILVAAQDTFENGCLLELSRRVWTASNDLRRDSEGPPAPKPAGRGPRRNTRQPA
jgi:hypothetical protein